MRDDLWLGAGLMALLLTSIINTASPWDWSPSKLCLSKDVTHPLLHGHGLTLPACRQNDIWWVKSHPQA